MWCIKKNEGFHQNIVFNYIDSGSNKLSGYNAERKKELLTLVDYGRWNAQNDSLSVELKLREFKDFRELLNRTEDIVCNDSLPKVTIRTDQKIKTIYFHNPCWENYGCILIKQKNVIEIHNDTIFKSWELSYPLDSLENVLRRDIENYGKNPEFADNPKKLLICVSYDSLQPYRLYRTLDGLTNVYSKITDSTNINIWLNERIDFIPPPPPPNGPEYVEEIKLTE
ncbi:MAG: hypothetical protein WBG90_14500 [Saonia sp.]